MDIFYLFDFIIIFIDVGVLGGVSVNFTDNWPCSYSELLGEINAERSQQLAMEAQEMNMSIALAF